MYIKYQPSWFGGSSRHRGVFLPGKRKRSYVLVCNRRADDSAATTNLLQAMCSASDISPRLRYAFQSSSEITRGPTMTDVLLAATSLAGFLFAQVTAVLAERPTSDLTPVAFVVKGESQKFMLFSGDTLQAMVGNGRRELSNQQYDAWAFAYE